MTLIFWPDFRRRRNHACGAFSPFGSNPSYNRTPAIKTPDRKPAKKCRWFGIIRENFNSLDIAGPIPNVISVVKMKAANGAHSANAIQ